MRGDEVLLLLREAGCADLGVVLESEDGMEDGS